MDGLSMEPGTMIWSFEQAASKFAAVSIWVMFSSEKVSGGSPPNLQQDLVIVCARDMLVETLSPRSPHAQGRKGH